MYVAFDKNGTQDKNVENWWKEHRKRPFKINIFYLAEKRFAVCFLEGGRKAVLVSAFSFLKRVSVGWKKQNGQYETFEEQFGVLSSGLVPKSICENGEVDELDEQVTWDGKQKRRDFIGEKQKRAHEKWGKMGGMELRGKSFQAWVLKTKRTNVCLFQKEQLG